LVRLRIHNGDTPPPFGWVLAQNKHSEFFCGHAIKHGTRLPNIAQGVPQLDKAMQKCIWWNGSGQ
jgi:hypothetical protein